MEHADEMLQIGEGDLLRREIFFELFLDALHARLTIEHAEDRVFLFVKPEVGEPDRLFDDPVDSPLIAVFASLQVGTHAQRNGP
jgi:hypothetical protein